MKAPDAVRDLEKLRASLRAEVHDAIEAPPSRAADQDLEARIKRLRGVSRPQFRLPVRDVRVFYEVVATEVHIFAIVSKEQAEGWLRQVGK